MQKQAALPVRGGFEFALALECERGGRGVGLLPPSIICFPCNTFYIEINEEAESSVISFGDFLL